MRVLQISDTHVSRRHQHFARNVESVRAWVERQAADLVVHTGDVSMNGAVTSDDLDDAAAWNRSLGHPVLSLPGNHDVGDMPDLRADQVLDDARLERYRAIMGADRWVRDLDGWRLVGIDAMLLGTGHPDERMQHEWLEETLAGTAPTALFLHKPLFVDDPDEGPHGYWTVPPAPRRQVLDLLRRADIRLVASGHLHVSRHAVFDGVSHVWGPSAAFVCGPIQAGVPGERRIGAVLHDFRAAGVTSRTVFIDGTQDLAIDPVLGEIYPAPSALDAVS